MILDAYHHFRVFITIENSRRMSTLHHPLHLSRRRVYGLFHSLALSQPPYVYCVLSMQYTSGFTLPVVLSIVYDSCVCVCVCLCCISATSKVFWIWSFCNINMCNIVIARIYVLLLFQLNKLLSFSMLSYYNLTYFVWIFVVVVWSIPSSFRF